MENNNGFKYLDIDEVKKLSLFDFVSYCEKINDEMSSCQDGELCRAKDDFIVLKGIEDAYITFCLKKVYEDSGYGVIGFNFDFDLSVNDADWVKSVERVCSIRLDSDRTGYVIHDSRGLRIPFSFVDVVGVILKELLSKVAVFYENKFNVIETDID